MKGIADDHSKFMTKEDMDKLQNLPSYHCTLNYLHKNSSVEKKIRPTSNFSSPHPSGSLNLHCISGAKRVLTVDITKAYRSMKITDKSKSLSLLFWVKDKDDPNSM